MKSRRWVRALAVCGLSCSFGEVAVAGPVAGSPVSVPTFAGGAPPARPALVGSAPPATLRATAQPVTAPVPTSAAPGQAPQMLADPDALEVTGEATTAVATPVASAAPESQRSWLRQPRQASDEGETRSSGWSMSVLALVLLGGLAGGAVFMKMRRGAPVPWMPPSAVRVLSTTRLGPKASLITADVHGRVLLLGVTEQTVSELGWIDELSETPAAEEDEPSEAARQTLAPSATTPRAGFGRVLGSVLGAPERKGPEAEFRGNPNVAALIAARDTRDVVTTSYGRGAAGAERRTSGARSPSTEPAPVETQVAGLVRRRR